MILRVHLKENKYTVLTCKTVEPRPDILYLSLWWMYLYRVKRMKEVKKFQRFISNAHQLHKVLHECNQQLSDQKYELLHPNFKDEGYALSCIINERLQNLLSKYQYT